jgi:hypothetical protein
MTPMTRRRILAALRRAGRYLAEGLVYTGQMAYPDPRTFRAEPPVRPERPPPDRADAMPAPAMRAYRVDEYVIWLEDSGDGR